MKWHSTGSLISNLAQTAMSYCQLATEGPGWPQNCQLHLKKSTCSRKSRSSKHNLEWEEEEQRGLMSLCFSCSLWHDARSGALWRTVSPCAIWVRIWFVNNSKAWLNVFGGLDDSVGVSHSQLIIDLGSSWRSFRAQRFLTLRLENDLWGKILPYKSQLDNWGIVKDIWMWNFVMLFISITSFVWITLYPLHKLLNHTC